MKINLKGITAEAITGVIVLILALTNAVLQMVGIKVIPIENDTISELVSALFLVATALYNTWKNRNVTQASQLSQQLTDAMKQGTIAVEKVEEIIAQIKG